MLKKIAVITALLILINLTLAAEQDTLPNMAGVVKITCEADGYTALGLPFTFWALDGSGDPIYGTVSTKPSDIIRDQLTHGWPWEADEVIRKDNGQVAYRGPDSLWHGPLETNANMEVGRYYWIHSRQDSAQDLFLVGEVDSSTYGPIAVDSGYTPLSFRTAFNRPLDSLNLTACGFTGGLYAFQSDELLEKNTGNVAWYRTSDQTWQGAFGYVTPGYGYYIHDRGGLSWDYYYRFDCSQAPPPQRPDRGDRATSSVGQPQRPGIDKGNVTRTGQPQRSQDDQKTIKRPKRQRRTVR